MTTFYIDPTTDASGDGSFANPWDSGAGAATQVAGNTYLQKQGTTFTGTIGPLGTGGTLIIQRATTPPVAKPSSLFKLNACLYALFE